jgi:ADP-ribose pyrophosphatase YjhB (NUDIX family)
VLLLDQPHHRGLALPGGLLARHERPVQCIEREVREELGVEISVGEEPSAVLVDGHGRRVDLVFLIRDAGLPFAPTSAEVRAVHWLPLSALPVGTAAERAVRAALRREETLG